MGFLPEEIKQLKRMQSRIAALFRYTSSLNSVDQISLKGEQACATNAVSFVTITKSLLKAEKRAISPPEVEVLEAMQSRLSAIFDKACRKYAPDDHNVYADSHMRDESVAKAYAQATALLAKHRTPG
jgi:hypothetical protein